MEENDYFVHCNIGYYTTVNTKERPGMNVEQMGAKLGW
jgi:hypothetical protein